MRTIQLCLFVTVLSPAVMGQPLLQHLVDFLGGIKYVPPPSSEAKVHKGEPIFNKEKEEERPKRGSAVAFEAGIEPASSNQVVRDWEQVGEWEYRAGEEDVTQVEATAWCQGQGGKLAQVGEEARKVVARLPSFHHWVQRPEGPSAPIRFSATSRQEDCWILEAGTDRAVARDCDVARQGSFGVRALCQRRRDQECTAPFFLDTAISCPGWDGLQTWQVARSATSTAWTRPPASTGVSTWPPASSTLWMALLRRDKAQWREASREVAA